MTDSPLSSEEFLRNKADFKRAVAHELGCSEQALAVDPKVIERVRQVWNKERFSHDNGEAIGSYREQALDRICNWVEDKGVPLNEAREEELGNYMDAMLDQYTICMEWNRRAEAMFDRSKGDQAATARFNQQKKAIEAVRVQVAPFYLLGGMEALGYSKDVASKIVGSTAMYVFNTMLEDLQQNPCRRGATIRPPVASGSTPDMVVDKIVTRARHQRTIVPVPERKID